MELVCTRNTEKRFGAHFTLGPVNLSLRDGELLGIRGDRGSGKTTLLRLIWGFFRPDRGEVSVFRQQPHLHQLSIRRRTGFLPASPVFKDCATVSAHLQFVAEFYEGWDQTAAEALLAQYGIDPEGCVGQLSRIEKLKLALIGASSHHPLLLLLDDPLKGLAAAECSEITLLLKSLAEKGGVGIIVTARGTKEISNWTDRILELREGQVVNRNGCSIRDY